MMKPRQKLKGEDRQPREGSGSDLYLGPSFTLFDHEGGGGGGSDCIMELSN